MRLELALDRTGMVIKPRKRVWGDIYGIDLDIETGDLRDIFEYKVG